MSIDIDKFAGWNRAMIGAYKKGAAAFAEGRKLSDNPYKDKRKPSGGLSWSRAFSNAWQDGWMDAERQERMDRVFAY